MNLEQPAALDKTRYVQWGKAPSNYAVIWLHGLGASSDDFPPVVPHLGLDENLSIQFVFPHAPTRPITINGGMPMPAWYDIKGLDVNDRVDREGIIDSMKTLEWHIADLQEQGIPSENIIVAGFSQGGAVSYYSLLRSGQKFAGVLLLSTYMPFPDEAAKVQNLINAETPVFIGHGTFDPVVTFNMGESSMQTLKSLSYDIEWKTYPIQHNVDLNELQDIGRWINALFK